MSFTDSVVTKVSSRKTQEKGSKQCERWAVGWRELWVAEGSLPHLSGNSKQGSTDWRAKELPNWHRVATNGSGERCNSLEFSTFSVPLPERWGSSNALNQTMPPGHSMTSVPAIRAVCLHCALPSHRHSQWGGRCGCQTGRNMPGHHLQVHVLSVGHAVTPISYNKSTI